MPLPKPQQRRTYWTTGMLAKLTQLHQEGLTHKEIGERMGLDKKTITNKLHQLRKQDKPSELAAAERQNATFNEIMTNVMASA